jgi:hypothetical protein
MAGKPTTELSAEQRHEVAVWIEANSATLPESVRTFLALHQRYLAAEGDLRRALDVAWRELRRALHITPSSEKRRSSGSPLANMPQAKLDAAKSEREELEAQIARSRELADWHRDLKKQHGARVKRLEEKLAKMPVEKKDDGANKETDVIRLEDIELTEEDRADAKAAGDRFVEHLRQGSGADPAMKSVNETLMPGGAVLVGEEQVSLPAELPEDLADAQVIKTLSEQRVRYDFSVAVTRIALEVEKKVVVDHEGERHVIASSTNEYGPPRYSVTWAALATLAVLVGQFAMPFNRLATLFSTPEKRFTAGAFSRMLHYVAQRLLPIYLELASELTNCEILAGDDTSCRVLEVSTYFAESSAQAKKPPWAAYQTPSAAEESLRRCEEAQEARVRRREDGDRTATRTPAETPSLGVLIGRKLVFESPRRNGDGPKEAMHVSVVSGRSVAEDPQSLIVFYRSHLGSCGNLFESILTERDPGLRKVILQGDMSTTNLVTAPDLLARFDIRTIGCSAHARRPFAIYKDEDLERCEYMLHLFLGLAIHEERLDAVGRNRDNALAVRGSDSRELWNDILELAKQMADKWSKATKLGVGARYIINHIDALTAYLDDPRLEPTNNLRERMLRMEKLIEGSSMFRRTLEGRFVLDVVRTILQTAVAASVPVHDYLVSVLRASDNDILGQPARFTPRAWAAAHLNANPSATTDPTAGSLPRV